MEISDQHRVIPPFTPREITSLSIEQAAVWALETFVQARSLLALQKRIQTPDHPAHCLVAIPIETLWLCYILLYLRYVLWKVSCVMCVCLSCSVMKSNATCKDLRYSQPNVNTDNRNMTQLLRQQHHLMHDTKLHVVT